MFVDTIIASAEIFYQYPLDAVKSKIARLLAFLRNVMQKQINLKVKYRESFRQFATIVLIEDLAD